MGTLVELPEWTLIIAVAAWVGTNIMVWIATGRRAGTILAGAKAESQAQKDEVVGHFDEELAKLDAGKVQEKIDALDVALGTKFEEWDEAMRQMPSSIAMALGSAKGVEMKALYGSAVEGEEEMEAYAAEVMDPADIAMAKLNAIEPNEDWKGKHPLGAMLIEAGKEFFKAKMDESRGIINMKRLSPPNSEFRGG